MKQKFSWPTAIESFRMSEHTVRDLTELAGSLKGDSKTHILQLLGKLSSSDGDQVLAHRWLLVGYLQTIEESFDSGGEDHPMISRLLEELMPPDFNPYCDCGACLSRFSNRQELAQHQKGQCRILNYLSGTSPSPAK
jgi:hypothetical protein